MVTSKVFKGREINNLPLKIEVFTSMKITPEIALIHGHLCGDGSVYISKEKRSPGSLLNHKRRNLNVNMWYICYTNNNKELLNEFADAMMKQFKRKAQWPKGKSEVRYKGCKHIIEKLSVLNKNSYSWSIPSFISNAPSKIVAHWLRAFFDDEGSVIVKEKKIKLDVVNERGLLSVRSLLKSLGIESKMYGPYKSKNPNHALRFRIVIGRNSLQEYHKKVSFTHPEKKIKLEFLVGQGGFEPPTPRSSAVCSPRLSYCPI